MKESSVQSPSPAGTIDFCAMAMAEAKRRLSDLHDRAAVRIDGPIHRTSNSEIFHARIDTTPPLHAAVKHCRLPHTRTPDPAGASQQFHALERVHSALANGNPRFAVSAPLFLDRELATFAMSWIDDESVSRKMRRPTAFYNAADWFADIGAWLGTFHKAGPIRTEGLVLDERLTVIDDLCASALPHASFARALQLLQETAAPLQNSETEVSWVHGDCKTDNFIIGKDRIFGMDMSIIHENSVEFDIAQFLNNLQLMLASPMYAYLLGLRPQLETAFWSGYRSTGPTVSQAYLKWSRLLFAASFWHTRLRGQAPTMRNRILNSVFRKLTERLTRELAAPQ